MRHSSKFNGRIQLRKLQKGLGDYKTRYKHRVYVSKVTPRKKASQAGEAFMTITKTSFKEFLDVVAKACILRQGTKPKHENKQG